MRLYELLNHFELLYKSMGERICNYDCVLWFLTVFNCKSISFEIKLKPLVQEVVLNRFWSLLSRVQFFLYIFCTSEATGKLILFDNFGNTISLAALNRLIK